ncbi:NAD(P)-dependent dehydrogenase (short-subunit alcohol dehydrogenase family) [Lewinella aquimaris]|uniref:NAD(P)-dependent dehydrogenase (Short-subunit alcohol dehydrogenase family) n=1 Tax=Neolewinella aquimaris TaxID=1835722 RepID=A0A840E2T7_9BACT|nr:SDR family oxidoreductase [Neolewinella aquimaris]MBB4077985.1 NAD(P)-dependent dehydrogenase (short-subunit alcohol dehydrogenase family) [Neolewinella aquimaris]
MSTTKFGKQGWTPERLHNLNGRTYLITGANAGTGFEAAKILLKKGAEVVMLNRSAERSQAAINDVKQELGAGANVRYILMDLGDLSSVRTAAEEVLATTPRIDALICNAAVAQVASQEFTKDGFESQLGINHYGHFLLVNLLYDRIVATAGRIVVVASEGYKMGLRTIQFDDLNFNENYSPNTVYSQSKLAQMLFAYELQRRGGAAGRNVSVYVCHPGASSTSLIRKDSPLMTRITWSLMRRSPLVQSAERGAYPEVMCATEPDLDPLAYYGPTGMMNMSGPVGRVTPESHAQDWKVAAKLWDVSEQATKCKWNLNAVCKWNLNAVTVTS